MASVDLDATPGFSGGKQKALRAVKADEPALFDLQERLYAEGKQSVLVVLQGMDTSGKDGTITHVVGNFNPQGVDITAFKAPTAEDRKHNFLWRIRQHVPPPGGVGIFNRSHYEDVLIVRVHGLAPPQVIERRYGEINAFEKQLVKGGTKVVKICLHISYEEQRRRFIDRLKDPDKHWKFNEHDIDERALWDDYMSAYGIAITRCSEVPWYVIPANHKPYRNWAVSKILRETLEEMNPKFPRPKLDVPRLMKRLRPSGASGATSP
jgi:PPK2 family polyphosphate:nucleotide phosphotransferase